MSATGWTKEDVMKYYGKWLKNEANAVVAMNLVKDKVPQFYKLGFTARMNELRRFLIEELGYEDIPFTPNYVRTKHE